MVSFVANGGQGDTNWITDGTAAGTINLGTAPIIDGSSFIHTLVAAESYRAARQLRHLPGRRAERH
jgi:hypothetical protein